MDVTVYRPEVIAEAPFPNQTQQEPLAETTPSVSGVYKPSTIKEKSFPAKKIATELLSQALNTRSKKILQEFEFRQEGAIQIGEYTQGVAGDIRISPSGIVGRNSLGTTTFALDGETGDAIFAGLIQTGTIVSGLALLGDGSIEIDGINKRIVFYEDDIPVILIGNA